MKSLLSTTLIATLPFLFSPSTFAAESLPLDSFLSQVKASNPGLKGSVMTTQAGQLRSVEGDIALAPTLYFNGQFTSDAKFSNFTFFNYNTLITQTYSLGVSQQFDFGLQAKIHYDLQSIAYVDPQTAALAAAGFKGIVTSYGLASTVLEVSQSLWSNGFGRTTRAVRTQAEAQALASSYNASYQAKSTLSNAEITYWRLVLARQNVAVQTEALDRARKIYEWNVKRVRLQLADRADEIQAEALVQSRQLDLMSAKNEERSASLQFNSVRNIESDQVPEKLAVLEPKMLERVQIPTRATYRDDVKAAQQQARASIATSEISTQKDTPTLDVYASVALNGQSGFPAFTSIGSSIPYSLAFNRPTETVGVRFSMPLDFGTVSKSQEGWKQEHIASDLNLDRKVFEQEINWKDLTLNLSEAKAHLDLSRKLETTQRDKLDHERDRLHKGRSTTYQVLLFEQDYLLAQLSRIHDQFNILNIIAQMKTFGETL